jgi:5-methylcytosine-specific restriction endonuclease McrA
LKCNSCQERRPRDLFYKGSGRCKPCTKLRDAARKRSTENPEVWAVKRHKRRAAGTLDRYEVALLKLIEPTCRKCNKSGALQLDHITPVKLGGLTEWDNSQMLCQSCNARKGATEADYRRLVMWV